MRLHATYVVLQVVCGHQCSLEYVYIHSLIEQFLPKISYLHGYHSKFSQQLDLHLWTVPGNKHQHSQSSSPCRVLPLDSPLQIQPPGFTMAL